MGVNKPTQIDEVDVKLSSINKGGFVDL